jgi:hypothetical protein
MQRTDPELERSATEQLAKEKRPRLRDRLRWVALCHEGAREIASIPDAHIPAQSPRFDVDQCADLQKAILWNLGGALSWCCIPRGTAAKGMQGLEELRSSRARCQAQLNQRPV